MTASSLLQQQRLRVCEVCSSYLENFDGVHDNDKRLADHYGGKLHLGFIDLRCGFTKNNLVHVDFQIAFSKYSMRFFYKLEKGSTQRTRKVLYREERRI